MIIIRSPYRISLLGGMSDYDQYLDKYKVGTTVNFAIDKYSYIAAQKLDKFPSRIIYSKTEYVDFNGDIKHDGIWAAVNREDLFLQPLEITHFSDLGSNLGLGSSSAFMAALIKSLLVLKEEKIDTLDLIQKTVNAEQSYSTVGWQDATASILGGLRVSTYSKNEDKVSISSIPYNGRVRRTIEEYGLLFNTGQLRNSSDNIDWYIDKISESENVKKIYELAEEGANLLDEDDFDIEKFGYFLHKNWQYKKHVSDKITTSQINYLIEAVLHPLVFGAKLLGGGAGGCIFALGEPKNHSLIIELMEAAGCVHIPYKIDTEGVKQLQ